MFENTNFGGFNNGVSGKQFYFVNFQLGFFETSLEVTLHACLFLNYFEE